MRTRRRWDIAAPEPYLPVNAVQVFMLQIDSCWASVPAREGRRRRGGSGEPRDCVYLFTPVASGGSRVC